jgi:hypothetical protein
MLIIKDIIQKTTFTRIEIFSKTKREWISMPFMIRNRWILLLRIVRSLAKQ